MLDLYNVFTGQFELGRVEYEMSRYKSRETEKMELYRWIYIPESFFL